MDNDTIRDLVRARNAAIARGADTAAEAECCTPTPAAADGACCVESRSEPACCVPAPTEATGCCGTAADAPADRGLAMGYAAADLAAVGDGANLGLGCGNPNAIAALRAGEVVVDLGSGAGFDCFLAARAVGPTGRVIGVDMTPEMVSRALANAVRMGVGNVTFRLGEIEHLASADSVADVILSNCVINLVSDKAAVYRDAFRVLRPGGRLAIADVIASGVMPDAARTDPALRCGCIGGAATEARTVADLRDAGFTDIAVIPRPASRDLIAGWAPGSGAEDWVVSADIRARKPA